MAPCSHHLLWSFLDANVLFSRTLRDWICLLCLEGKRTAYDVRWSEDVLTEWIYRMRRRNPALGDAAVGGSRRRLMAAFPGALIIGYEPLSVPAVADPDDRHVLAAAVHGEVDLIITEDRKARFEMVVPEGIAVVSADEFLMRVADAHPELVPLALERQLEHFQRAVGGSEWRTAYDLADRLIKSGAPTFARHLAGMLNLLGAASSDLRDQSGFTRRRSWRAD